MKKNEIVAEFMEIPDSANPYDELYDFFMPAWMKFRDLKIDDFLKLFDHADFRRDIGQKILYGTITEAFDELVKGIEWYNSLKK